MGVLGKLGKDKRSGQGKEERRVVRDVEGKRSDLKDKREKGSSIKKQLEDKEYLPGRFFGCYFSL